MDFKKIKEELELRKHILSIITAPLEKEIALLQRICADKGHKIIPRNPKITEELKTDIWASTGALCEACGKTFGWWCPKSPDHHCHYDGVRCTTCGHPVVNFKDAMKEHTRMYQHGNMLHATFVNIKYCADSCIFCGMPEERK